MQLKTRSRILKIQFRIARHLTVTIYKSADSVSFLSKLISDICENNEIAFDEEWR